MTNTKNKVNPAHTDVDIDFQDRTKALAGLDYIVASRDQNGKLLQHNTGVYFQKIPYNPITNLANVDHKEAEDRGYFKLDFLNVHLYDGVENEAHLDALLAKEPVWELLEHEEFVEELWHLGNHYKLVNKKRPTSIPELAMLLAVIRPAKYHLRKKSWDEISKTVWDKPEVGDDGYEHVGSFFKRAHAHAYAAGIVVQMNLIVEKYS